MESAVRFSTRPILFDEPIKRKWRFATLEIWFKNRAKTISHSFTPLA
jgi:hypothetical protein